MARAGGPKPDPRDPRIVAWLMTLAPKDELVMRYAMRAAFSEQLVHDPAFTARVDTLAASLKLDEDALAILLRAARAITAKIGELMKQAASVPPGKSPSRRPSRPSSASSSSRRSARKQRSATAGAKARGRRPTPT